MSTRMVSFLVLAVWSASAQTNPLVTADRPETFQTATSPELSQVQRYEKTRIDCIEARRIICGKILKVLPSGLVIDSGYTNLMRAPINKSWLVPGTVVATRAANLVEANQPDSVCVGLVFLVDQPKSRGKPKKPKQYDYVNVEGFPIGTYTYASVGGVQRTVRRFTTKLAVATQWHFDQSEQTSIPAK